MIQVIMEVGKEHVIANYPQNDAEAKLQQELVRVSKLAQVKYPRVGLWILAEIELGKYHIVLSSINKAVSLSESDLAAFRAAIVEKMGGEQHAR